MYGTFDALMNTSYSGKAYVDAYRIHCISTGRWSFCRYILVSKAQTYIYPAPHIEVTPDPPGGVQIDGSGFTPGATVRIEVLDTSLNPVNTHYVTADSFGIGAGTFFTGASVPCGPMYIAVDGAPGPTRWAKVKVC